MDITPMADELESDHELAEMVAPFDEQFPGLARRQDQPLTEAELAPGQVHVRKSCTPWPIIEVGWCHTP
jgi:hypothetical protein